MTGSLLENKAQPTRADPLASGPWVLGRQPSCVGSPGLFLCGWARVGAGLGGCTCRGLHQDLRGDEGLT